MILVDAGPIIAIFNARDADHVACVETMATLKPPILTCWPVISEAAYMLEKVHGAVALLLASIEDGTFKLLSIDDDAIPWIAAYMKKYGAQLADVALAYLAERDDIRTVFTLDRRDFLRFRIKGKRSLKLIP